MTAKTRPFVTGFCNSSNPLTIHETCKRFWSGNCNCRHPECPCNPDSAAADPSPAAADQARPEEVPAGVETEGVQPPPVEIRAPGVFDDMPEDVYHAPWTVPSELGGSLSNSGAKTLLGRTPAHFQWERQHGRPPKKAYDVGHAAHSKVLGIGQPIKVIDGNRNANAVKAEIAEAEAAGFLVLKSDENGQVEAMAEAVLAHNTARRLFEAEAVREQSMFWQDPATGVYLRCRPDSRVQLRSGRRVLVDLKTTVNADPDDFGKTADNHGYVQQHPFYLAGAQTHGLVDEESSFLFVLVEKEPPYLVSVCELDDEAVLIGRQRNRRAIDLFAQCSEDNHWPGYPPSVVSVSLPYWTVRNHNEEYVA